MHHDLVLGRGQGKQVREEHLDDHRGPLVFVEAHLLAKPLQLLRTVLVGLGEGKHQHEGMLLEQQTVGRREQLAATAAAAAATAAASSAVKRGRRAAHRHTYVTPHLVRLHLIRLVGIRVPDRRVHRVHHGPVNRGGGRQKPQPMEGRIGAAGGMRGNYNWTQWVHGRFGEPGGESAVRCD